MSEVVRPLGWEVVNWMGTDAAINNIIGTLFAAGADDDNNAGTAYTQPATEALCLDPSSDGAQGAGGDGADVAGTWTPNGFSGSVATNAVVTDATTDELRWVSWKDGGMDPAGDGIGAALIEIATFQVKVLQDGDSSEETLTSQNITFNTSGEFLSQFTDAKLFLPLIHPLVSAVPLLFRIF